MQSKSIKHLVFLDETGANTKMIRRYGWRPKDSRVISHVPHGHWKTTTFVAALRATGLSAPLVLDGAMNGESFLAYVQQFLVPTLQVGDIVVMDNLSSHKQTGVVEGIRTAGAEVFYLPPYSPDLNPIEKVFAKLKGLLRQHGERTREALWDRIGNGWMRTPRQNASTTSTAADTGHSKNENALVRQTRPPARNLTHGIPRKTELSLDYSFMTRQNQAIYIQSVSSSGLKFVIHSAGALVVYLLCRILVSLSLLATMVSTLRAFPHELAYFNELAGGPQHGEKHLLGSNLDWGQDLLLVRSWMQSQNVNPAQVFVVTQYPSLAPLLLGTATSQVAASWEIVSLASYAASPGSWPHLQVEASREMVGYTCIASPKHPPLLDPSAASRRR